MDDVCIGMALVSIVFSHELSLVPCLRRIFSKGSRFTTQIAKGVFSHIAANEFKLQFLVQIWTQSCLPREAVKLFI